MHLTQTFLIYSSTVDLFICMLYESFSLAHTPMNYHPLNNSAPAITKHYALNSNFLVLPFTYSARRHKTSNQNNQNF